MSLEIITLVLGPVATNTYLLADTESGEAAVIDPAWSGEVILGAAQERGWKITQLWYTHAHFDHFGGAAEVAAGLESIPVVALHPADRFLWDSGGGGSLYGFQIDPGPEPTIDLSQVRTLTLGSLEVAVHHTPGHSPGHCVFHCMAEDVLFSGDLLFQGGVGRTDLPGGEWQALEQSIRTAVYTLPEATRVLPGHGPATTVGDERMNNPFVYDVRPPSS